MNTSRSRREFLGTVGQGMLAATVGAGLAADLNLAEAAALEGAEPLSFGQFEPLVVLMQETPIEKLLPTLVDQVNRGTELKTLVAVAALANARTFGGDDYVGFHTLMALAPAWHMSQELTGPQQALPIFKVLYRNTNRIAEHGRRANEVLHRVQPAELKAGENGREALREAVRAKDLARAESIFAALAKQTPQAAFEDLLHSVQDNAEVHRTVLPYRAWELLSLVGEEHAHTLLRQSVHYCVREHSVGDASKVLAAMFDDHKLADRAPGDRAADDAWIDSMSRTIFSSAPEQAAGAAAAALAEGFSPAALREAIALAANQLVLRDSGRNARQEWPGKPIGSVHGDSVGVHASDSANAWCNMATAGSPRNKFACLILGAYQVALDRTRGGGDYLNLPPLPIDEPWRQLTITKPKELLDELDTAIRGNLQAQACNVVNRYGELHHDPSPVFQLLLAYAVSEDGALHAEKYYRTTSEEFARTRPAFRWRHAVALARVTASEFGRPAPGYEEARSLLERT